MAKREKSPEQAAPTPMNGADADHGLGEFFDQFQQPRKVGDLTVGEVTELKTRNKALERLNADIAHFASLRAIATNEKVAFIRSIGSKWGLGPRDELSVNDETGDVVHTGTRRYVQPSEVQVEEVPPPAPDVVAVPDPDAPVN